MDYVVDFKILVVSVFLPFFSFLFLFLFGNRLGNYGSFIVSIFGTFFSFLFVTFHFMKIIFFFCEVNAFTNDVIISNNNRFFNIEFFIFNWLDFFSFKIYWSFLFDFLSISMMWLVLFITLMVQFYCFEYIWFDPFFSRFYSLLSLFSFFMIILVTASNFVQFFFGWEGVGLVSFLLISFWHTRKDAVMSGLKAIFINRIGDIFFLLVCIVSIDLFSDISFLNVFYFFQEVDWRHCDNFWFLYKVNILSVFIIFASMSKSAQLGMHVWLPDAMEGPTPVSALLHAATMVTAGIYFIIRVSFFFSFIRSVYVCNFIIIIGSLTAFFGSTVACFQYDIKKIIAYSTCSQLGYMMLACGVGNFTGSYFHLFNHAFFKALLFLAAGSIIHSLNNEQDIRRMGSIFYRMPITFIFMFLGSFSLIGIPGFSGFYSKDNIIEYCFFFGTSSSFFGLFLGLFSIFFTSYYSFRMLYYIFFTSYSGSIFFYNSIHESSVFMLIPMFILSIFSIFSGFIFFDYFVGKYSSSIWYFTTVRDFCFINESYYVNNDNYVKFFNFVMNCPLYFIFFSFIIFYIIEVKNFFGYNYFFKNNKYIYIIRNYFINKWYFDDLYNIFIAYIYKFLYFYYWKEFEMGILQLFGPMGILYIIEFFKSIPSFFSSINPIYIFRIFIFFIVVSTLICLLYILLFFKWLSG